MPVKIQFGQDARVDEQPCPECGAKLDAATVLTNPGKVLPTSGDFTVCIYCATILRFGAGGKLEKPTTDELREARRQEPDMFEVLQRVKVAAILAIEDRRRRRQASHWMN